MARLRFVVPFVDKLDQCLSIGQAPSQGLVYGLDDDIVLKLPCQYIIPDDLDHEATFYLNHGVRSFVAIERELAVYGAVVTQPHPNIARRLKVDSSLCLFLERLKLLEQVWADSDERIRHRWVTELLDGISHLEELCYIQGDLAVRNLGVDVFNRLKIFDFGSATTTDHYDYAADLKRDHFGLATCLHYILTGVDPFTNVSSALEARLVETQLTEGRGRIEAGAEILADVIQAGWTGESASTRFSQIKSRVEAIINIDNSESIPEHSGKHYQHLESRCVDWVQAATPDPRWIDPQECCAACVSKGYDVDMDSWR